MKNQNLKRKPKRTRKRRKNKFKGYYININIIGGVNGVGKSNMMRIIWYAINQDCKNLKELTNNKNLKLNLNI